MKRCFKWLINWFTKLGKEDRIGYVIGGIISIILAISIFVAIDKVPATPSDYMSQWKSKQWLFRKILTCCLVQIVIST